MKEFSAVSIFAVFWSIVFWSIVGCGGTSSSVTSNPVPTPTPTPAAPSIIVTVSPASVTVRTGTEFSAFSASVINTTNTAVNWFVDNVPGGNSTVGAIDNSGHYMAPATAGNHTVTAVSQENAAVSGSAQVTVTQSFTVAISPPSAAVAASATQQFMATVTPSPNLGVTWSVDSIAGGNATVGTVSANGLYTAPATSGGHTIAATSNDEPASTASAQITIPEGISIAPATARVSLNSTEQFTVTATDPSVLPVTWSVDSVAGGNAIAGTISSAGLYTAPAGTGIHTVSAASSANAALTASVQVTVVPLDFGAVSVLTFHNDNQRTGLNPNETILNPTNVNSTTFGKVFSYPLDGQMYAQPLFTSGLPNIAGGVHNVVYAVTENDSVYAFDADGLSTAPLWQKSLGTPVPVSDSEGINPKLGITGTPAIDGSTDTLYVVAETQGGVFNLHALDLHDGSEKFGGPVQITASVPGTGMDSVNGTITLEPACYQRPALALVSGIVFISFGHCNHGWILGYSASTLAHLSTFNPTPDGGGGGFWMGGSGGPATDGLGNLFVISGVDFGDPASGFNDTFLKLSVADLSVIDFFTPSNESVLRENDADLGSGGALVLPTNTSAHPNELVGGGKDGRVFLVDQDHMGGFNTSSNPACDSGSAAPADCDLNVQTLPNIGVTQFANLFCTPAYWNGTIYFHPQSSTLQAFSYSNGLLSTSALASGAETFGSHGATPIVSANGTSGAIVWELQVDAASTNGPAILRAYDATNVATELYDSTQAASGRDTAGPAIKFTAPTVVNGHVYVGTGNQLDVYGLLSQ